jgi:hypothetical protein
MKYEALTNASPSPTCPHGFKFRSGDRIELTDEQAESLLKAGAVRLIEARPPQKVEATRKGATKGE